MREPNSEDAKILLQLETLRYTPDLDEAFRWAWAQFQHANDPVRTHTPADLAAEEEAVGRFSTFFETAGVLVRSGLLHEDIFYDRYMVSPFWKLARDSTERQRKMAGTVLIGENFEWLAEREPAVTARLEQRSRSARRVGTGPKE